MKTASVKKTKGAAFDKYAYYRRAVQAPDHDVIFLRDTYKELHKKEPVVLREDFCGTFAICCEWVKLSSRYQAFGVDLDPEPIQYGHENYFPELRPAQRERVGIRQMNVLSPEVPKADVVCAMNFSHFIFKQRETMKSYFKNVHASLKSDGVFIADCFGGSQCYGANEEKTQHKGFRYYWDQESYDPVTGHAMFHIHFKPDGRRKIEKVFSYDWRLWSIPELREIMLEAGFQRTHVYWEGTTRSGKGNGVFTRSEKGEECQAWIAYVVGEK